MGFHLLGEFGHFFALSCGERSLPDRVREGNLRDGGFLNLYGGRLSGQDCCVHGHRVAPQPSVHQGLAESIAQQRRSF